jgi:hypothetical protein
MGLAGWIARRGASPRASRATGDTRVAPRGRAADPGRTRPRQQARPVCASQRAGRWLNSSRQSSTSTLASAMRELLAVEQSSLTRE